MSHEKKKVNVNSMMLDNILTMIFKKLRFSVFKNHTIFKKYFHFVKNPVKQTKL